MDKKVLRDIQSKIGEAQSMLESIYTEETDKWEEKSDKWKESAPGEALAAKISSLEEAIEALGSADTNIEDALAD